MTVAIIIALAVLGAMLAGAQIDRGANATPQELTATETEANGCLVLLIIVAALATLLVLAGAGGNARALSGQAPAPVILPHPPRAIPNINVNLRLPYDMANSPEFAISPVAIPPNSWFNGGRKTKYGLGRTETGPRDRRTGEDPPDRQNNGG